MDNQLPMKKNENIFSKIKSFFKNLFHKEEVKETVEKKDNEPNEKSSFLEDIQVKEVAENELKNKKMRELVEAIKNNPEEEINKLSDDTLDVLIDWYDREIAKISSEIENLEKKIQQNA